jgi:hypothetical protein
MTPADQARFNRPTHTALAHTALAHTASPHTASPHTDLAHTDLACTAPPHLHVGGSGP